MKTLSKKLCVCAIICLLLIGCFTLSACGSKQITIDQIRGAIGNSYVEYTVDADKISEQKLEWAYAMEKQNVDSEHLVAVAVFNFYNFTNRINILKFSKEKYAKQMIQKYNFGDSVTAKRYGNLVVVVSNQVQLEIFTLINSIK